MNNTPARRSNLQARLSFFFSILFVFSMLALSLFLYNIVQLVALNNEAQQVYAQTRQVYQLQSLLKQYQLGLKNYEISSSPFAEDELAANGQRLDALLQALAVEQPAENAALFEALAGQKARLSRLAAQIIDAVDFEDSKPYEEQDWSRVEQLDRQAADLFGEMFVEVDSLRAGWQARQDSVQQQASFYGWFALAVGVLSIPIFFGLAVLLTTINAVQINLPLETLAQAARDLRVRKFDPRELDGLARRSDEVGQLARDFLHMAGEVQQREAQLQAEAEEIRAKIK